VKTVRICNPVRQEPYPSFLHQTTQYVAVPHCSPYLLYVDSDEACTVSLQVAGREVMSLDVGAEPTHIPLSDLPVPKAQPDGLMDLLASKLARRKQACPPRLHAFSAVFVRNTPDRQVAATFDFHVLCPTEFEPARAFHLQLQTDPDAIAPDTIFDRAEGVHCPECRQLRALLNQ
jgi:hypothetical protein